MGTERHSPFGAFIIPKADTPCNRILKVVADSGEFSGWEHVSVSIAGKLGTRAPSWPEMDFVKHLFWSDDETVVQFHPDERQKVDVGEVLHLWKPRGAVYRLPPPILIGPLEAPRIIAPA